MMAFLLRWVVTAIALAVAVEVVPGVSYQGDWAPFFVVALVFGVINATLRPITKLLTCPLILLTLGLFSLVVNGLMLWLTSSIADVLGIDFRVSGFWAAFFGALVVSIVTTILSLFVGTDDRERRVQVRRL